jgi:CheY-like chemotaxis protein
VEYEPKGLRATFVIPPEYIADAEAPAVPALPEEPAQLSRTGEARLPDRILIVEDNYIIALEAENLLRDFGVKDVAIACSLDDAAAKIEDFAPDFVFLDVNLGDETSFAVAERLLEKKIPCAFVTGYGEQIDYPAPLKEIPCMLKPFTADGLRDLLGRARLDA